MRAARLVSACACLLAAALLLASCGGGSDGSNTNPDGGGGGAEAKSRPAPPTSDFPATAGRTLKQVLRTGDKPSALKLEPGAMVFYQGANRYPFSVYDGSGAEVTDAEVALYMAPVPQVKPGAKSKSGGRGAVAKAEHQALEQPAIGPFPAKIESLATDPEFHTGAEAGGVDVDTVVYSTELDFPREGNWRVAALVKEDGELGGKLLPGVFVGEFERVPEVGGKAPKLSSEDGDYADALGREPIVLLFTSPQFCQSRACGPVVDQAAQARQKYGDEAVFIQMDIYNHNNPADGVRPQVRAFHLPTEPWLFTIDRAGVIREAVEGPFGTELLDEAIEKAIR